MSTRVGRGRVGRQSIGRQRIGRAVIAVVGVTTIAVTASGCYSATEGDDGVTFRAERSAICAPVDQTTALIGVGIEMHGARGGTIDGVVVSKDGAAVDTPVWSLDTFPANQSVATSADAPGWATRAEPEGVKLSPGSHTLVVQLNRLSSASGATTDIDRMAVTYTIDGQTGTASSNVALGFGENGDGACD